VELGNATAIANQENVGGSIVIKTIVSKFKGTE